MKFLLLMIYLTMNVFAADFYGIKEKSITGQDYSLSQLKNKVVLVVNIASQCGYTSQLEKLETLFQKYKTQGLVVIGVPTNDFGGQTPENDKEMLEFCSKNYKVTFPILTKKTIQGKEKRELYKFLTEQTSKKLQGEVGWNFEKFLINKKGDVVNRFRSSMDPLDNELLSLITSLLKE